MPGGASETVEVTDALEPTQPRAPDAALTRRRVALLTACLWGLSLATYLLVVRHLTPIQSPLHAPAWAWAAALAVLLAITLLLDAGLYVGRDIIFMNFTEMALILGMVFVPPAWLPLAIVLAMLAWGIIRRRHYEKIAFNIGIQTLSICLALPIFRVVLDHSFILSARGWLAAFAGIAIEYLLSMAGVAAVIFLTTGKRPEREVAGFLPTAAIPVVVNASLALAGAYVIWIDPWGLWTLGILLGLFYLSYRAQTVLRARYSNLQSLYEFTQAVGSSVDQGAVTRTALEESARLLRASRAELVMISGSGRGSCSSLDAEGRFALSTLELTDTTIEGIVCLSGKGQLLQRGCRDPAGLALLKAAKAKDAVAVPFRLDQEVVGALIALDRLDDTSTFDAEDLRLFEALANHAGVALRNGKLVSQLRQEATDREHRALHDSLTALPNRTLFLERTEAALSESNGSVVAVLIIDLARFKEVNDTLGHANGDLLLKEAANRLSRSTGGRGTVARLGGDEFAILLPGLPGVQRACQLAEQICNGLRAPFELEDLPLEISANVGVAVFPDHGNDAATLLQRADVAMYNAKDNRSRLAVYEPELDHYSPRRLALVGELRHAIENGGLTLHYQPIAELRSGRIVGVEALVRWPHPKHGFLPPDEFIPIAEHTGLIHPLTRLVLREALRQSAEWRSRGLELSVAINISARNLLGQELVGEVRDALSASGVPPRSVTLELTESTVMSDLKGTVGTLARLSELGVSLAVDDFGTGYSSLSYLTRLPVETVKIDKSFIQHMSADPGDAVIVRSTIDLARNLGLRVIAEGVEDRATWDRLRNMDADMAQGYVIAKPLVPSRLESWLLVYGGSLRSGRQSPTSSRPPLRVMTSMPDEPATGRSEAR